MIGGSILKWFFYKPPRKCLDVAKLYYPDIFVLKKNRFLWYVQFTFNLQASEVGRGYFTTITITRLGRLQQVAYNRLLSRTQTTSSLFRAEVQVHILYGSYAQCGSMLSLKFFIYSKQQSAHSKHSDQRICQVVAHKRSKNTRKIVKLSGPKRGSGCLQEVVVY